VQLPGEHETEDQCRRIMLTMMTTAASAASMTQVGSAFWVLVSCSPPSERTWTDAP
jgi:hypothetical protein